LSIGIVELNERVKGINKNALLIEAVEINKEKLIKLNQQQLLQGLDATGKKIQPKYVKNAKGNISRYAIKKNQQNSAPGLETPDLNLTGFLFSEMDIAIGVPNDKEYTITSFASYAKYLFKNSGFQNYGDVFNLMSDSQKKAIILVTNTFNKLWKQKVFG